MTLVAALTVTRSPIAAFDATPALPVFAVGAVNVRVDLFLADLVPTHERAVLKVGAGGASLMGCGGVTP